MKVSSNSIPGSVAGAVAGSIRVGESVTLDCIGQSSVYRAIKALAIATVFLQRDDITLSATFGTEPRNIDSKEVTAYVIKVTGTGK